jgi:hypothetical protein
MHTDLSKILALYKLIVVIHKNILYISLPFVVSLYLTSLGSELT